MKRSNRAVKYGYIHGILKNSTYLPESGLYRNLAAALEKLTADQLCNLDLIVSIKSDDAVAESKPAGVFIGGTKVNQ